MHLVHWFEIPVVDVARAQAFYAGVFGVSFTPLSMGSHQMAMFPMEQGASGASGALIAGTGHVPSTDGTTVYFSVDDIEGTLSKIETHGGSTCMPKIAIGEHGFIAHFKDTEGNKVALHSMK